MEKDNISDLLNKVKANENSKTMQKVTPVNTRKGEEIQFSFYLSKQLLKKVKLKAIKEDTSLKNIMNKALEQYLKT
ncbi:hypothetical protein [Formosa algae]|uniref:HicB family RNase H-like nuclease n=1 Tax=Formosa algae TaxID=225843 RepID=A0A9X0YH37_9FLAO|nr:hypothetical protein [Formosa algae]MBP1838635.1 putative HicB family RNase H-like nuclease [Formosa algae]MDQ0335135.1 putative HicB family RNase H-like nuclease [Formosa algae]OEI80386.1 hypothetical protein AST99_09270 [Formosa algae]